MLFRPARASDLDEVCALLATPRRGPEYFHALFTSDPAFAPSQLRVAWTGGHIVACVKMYPRALRIGTTVVAAGGIGNLRTDPRYQQGGLATSLLAECVSALRLEGVVLAPLFVPSHAHALFARQGWGALRASALEIQAEALTATAEAEAGPRGRIIRLPQEVGVRPLESGDLDAVLALHESVNVARTGSVVRDCDMWLGSLATLDAQGARLLVAERGSELAGYVVAQPQGRVVEVLELLLAPWLQEAWRPLLRAALDTTAGATALSACLPRDYRALITGALGTRGDSVTSGDGGGRGDSEGPVTVRERDDLLVKVVDPMRLLKDITPLLATRLRKAPTPAPLRLRIGSLRGGAALSLTDTRIAVDTPGRDDPYILPESTFLALLFGAEDAYARLRDPASDGGLPALPEWALETLEHLFPPQDWIYWRSDAF